jgi:hypothetical protein
VVELCFRSQKINFIMINAYLMIGDDLMVDNDDW